ncbi:MAG: lysozyme inhibitor LprI family protein [Alphaproteobacteria bacterium]
MSILALCAQAAAQPVPDGTPLWRIHTENLAADRALIAHCLSANEDKCLHVVQDACLAGYDLDRDSPPLQRQCDWRAIAAWEDEMNDTLTRLRAQLGGRDLDNLNASQQAWETSMLADVGVGMDFFEGGSFSGPVGAHIRARATALRVLYLRYLESL